MRLGTRLGMRLETLLGMRTGNETGNKASIMFTMHDVFNKTAVQEPISNK